MFFSGPSLVSFPQFISNILDGRDERNENINGFFSNKNLKRFSNNLEGLKLKKTGDE